MGKYLVCDEMIIPLHIDEGCYTKQTFSNFQTHFDILKHMVHVPRCREHLLLEKLRANYSQPYNCIMLLVFSSLEYFTRNTISCKPISGFSTQYYNDKRHKLALRQKVPHS